MLNFIQEILNNTEFEDNNPGYNISYSWEWLPAKSSRNITEAYMEMPRLASVQEVFNKFEHINGGAFGWLMADNQGDHGNIGYLSLSKYDAHDSILALL